MENPGSMESWKADGVVLKNCYISIVTLAMAVSQSVTVKLLWAISRSLSGEFSSHVFEYQKVFQEYPWKAGIFFEGY